MVLTQLHRRNLLHGSARKVSIPLWFLRNQCLGFMEYQNMNYCFHTTMVLTQLTSLRKLKNYTQVSIPLWFLRNRILYPMKSRTTLLFPYHYGSRATVGTVMMYSSCISFHTTMVLAQRRFWRSRTLSVNWCFHTTMVLAQRCKNYSWCKAPSHVSIPLWFSRNKECQGHVGCPGIVSIPLWFSRNY